MVSLTSKADPSDLFPEHLPFSASRLRVQNAKEEDLLFGISPLCITSCGSRMLIRYAPLRMPSVEGERLREIPDLSLDRILTQERQVPEPEGTEIGCKTHCLCPSDEGSKLGDLSFQDPLQRERTRKQAVREPDSSSFPFRSDLLHKDICRTERHIRMLLQDADLLLQPVLSDPPVISIEEGGIGATDQRKKDLLCDLDALGVLIPAFCDHHHLIWMGLLEIQEDPAGVILRGVVVGKEYDREVRPLLQDALCGSPDGIRMIVGKKQDRYSGFIEDGHIVIRDDPGAIRQ